MNELYSLFNAYREDCKGLLNQSLNRLLEMADESFQQNTLELAFIGRMSVGKSSLINRLIGRDLLPSAAGPTTAKLTFLRRGPEDVLRVRLEDGAELCLAASPETILESSARPDVVSLTVELTDFPHDRATWVDTPGVEDLNDHRVDVTYGYLPTADAVVFVLDGGTILTQSELVFYQQKIMASHKDKVFLALNKFDLIDDDETPESLLERVSDHLGDELRRHQAHVLSARMSYGKAPALLDAFRADLDAYLGACDKQKITREKVRSLVVQAQASILEEMNVSLSGLGKEAADIQAEMAQLDADRLEAEERMKEIDAAFDERFATIREAVLAGFKVAASELMEGIKSCPSPDEKLQYLRQDAPVQIRRLTMELQERFEELSKTQLANPQLTSTINALESALYSQFQHLDKGIEIVWHLLASGRTPVAAQAGGNWLNSFWAPEPSKKASRVSMAPDGRVFVREMLVSVAGWAANNRLDEALKSMLEEFQAHLEHTLETLAGSLRQEAEFAGKALWEARRNGLAKQLEMLNADASVASQTREAIEQRKLSLEQSYRALMAAF